MANGKIVEGWDKWDQLGLLEQIGAVPVQVPKPVQAASRGLVSARHKRVRCSGSRKLGCAHVCRCH